MKAKKLDLGEPKKILSYALQPPNLADIERAILTLKEVGTIVRFMYVYVCVCVCVCG